MTLPDFLPGLGQLYVDPATLPAGPFLAYDHDGKLVSTIYMMPVEDLNPDKRFEDLAVGSGRRRSRRRLLQRRPSGRREAARACRALARAGGRRSTRRAVILSRAASCRQRRRRCSPVCLPRWSLAAGEQVTIEMARQRGRLEGLVRAVGRAPAPRPDRPLGQPRPRKLAHGDRLPSRRMRTIRSAFRPAQRPGTPTICFPTSPSRSRSPLPASTTTSASRMSMPAWSGASS